MVVNVVIVVIVVIVCVHCNPFNPFNPFNSYNPFNNRNTKHITNMNPDLFNLLSNNTGQLFFNTGKLQDNKSYLLRK